MLGKTNSSSGGKVSGTASYIFEKTTMAVSFPREALTSGSSNFFIDDKIALKSYIEAGNEAAYLGEYSDSWKVLQNSESWDVHHKQTQKLHLYSKKQFTLKHFTVVLALIVGLLEQLMIGIYFQQIGKTAHLMNL